MWIAKIIAVTTVVALINNVTGLNAHYLLCAGISVTLAVVSELL